MTGPAAPEVVRSADGRRDGPGELEDDTSGLTLTRQAPASAVVTVEIDGPPTSTWSALANHDAFQAALIDAALDVAHGRNFADLLDVLDEAGVDALHGAYRTLLARTAAGDRRAMFDLLRATRRLGTGRSPFEDVLGAARLFALDGVEATPTVVVRVGHDFRDLRAEQRRATCELIATLARGCDVRLVATGLVQRWLVDQHRADLPGVSEACNTPPAGRAPVDELVSAARGDLDPDGRKVRLLRALVDEPGETLTYRELYADFSVGRDVSNDHIRGCISDLKEAGLVATFGPNRDRRLELLEAGRAFVETLDREIGRQGRLDESVSGTGKPCLKSRVTPPTHEAAPQKEGADGPYQVRWMDRPTHAAAAASAVDGGLSLVDQPLEDGEEPRTHLVSYDETRDEAVVSIHASGAFPHVVSTAVALASPLFIDRVIPPERLEEIDEPPSILRDARCIGALSDEALADGDVLRDALVDWGLEIQELTTKLRHGDYEDRDRFRCDIMQSAHGLAGTITHLLTVLDVDLVRELRVPGGLDRETELGPLAKSVAISAAIQSRYGAFASYRQLFETREEKRKAALTPEVDAADPLGELIGGYVLRGPDLHRLEPSLKRALESPADVYENAPEIAIPVKVATGNQRPAYADAVRRMCEMKNLEATREAVSLFQALTGSPYDAARALQQLGREPYVREIEADEVRYSLATLPPDRILPGAAPTVSKAVHALLTADRPLTQAELAERAGISARSVRNHTERLEAFALIEATPNGYRFALPTRKERGRDRHPWYLTANRARDDYRDATEKGVLWEAIEVLDAPGDEAVMDALARFTTRQIPPDVRRDIVEVWPWAEPLLEAARVLAADEPDREVVETVSLGSKLEQAPLGAGTPSPVPLPVGD